MKTFIYVYETFAITIPANGEGPETKIRGYIVDGAPFLDQGRIADMEIPARGYTFRELIDLLRGLDKMSFAGMTWAMNPKYRTDAKTGAIESRAYHPKSKRDARYFWKAYNTANRLH